MEVCIPFHFLKLLILTTLLRAENMRSIFTRIEHNNYMPKGTGKRASPIIHVSSC